MKFYRSLLKNIIYKNVLVKITAGQTLIELILAMGLAAIIFPALFTGFMSSSEGKVQQQQRLQAITLLKETEQAVKNVRSKDWTSFANLSGQGALHPVISGSSWATASGPETINGVTRQFVVSNVQRNNGVIVTSGGTNDPSTKRIDITISWILPYTSSITSTMYLTRTTNLITMDTTIADFNRGTLTNASVSATVGSGIVNDGQVQLGNGGTGGAGGDWCKPANYVLATYNLPGQGVVQAISATSSAAQNVAYTTTGGNASGDAVDGLTISHDSTPIIANPSSNSEAKAYGIFVDNAGQYVYFNENNPPSHTVRIANASNLSDVGYFDVSHTTGSSIYVSGSVGYTTAQSASTLYSFDVSTIQGSSSQTQLGSVTLDGIGNRVVVVGTNAYVATSNTTNQLDIINVSDPTHMTKTKSINLGNGQGAVDVFVNSSQTYAYIVTSYTAGQNDFFIVDLTNTNNIWGYQTINGMSPNGITVVSGNRAILVGSGGEEYEVFNVMTPSAALHCGGMSPSGTTSVKAVAPIYWAGLAYSYILTDNPNAEFQIILGGSGGQYSSFGTYESGTFSPGYQAAFNKFTANISQQSNATISAQIAVAPAINNSCNGVNPFTYVGPNGTSSPNDIFTPVGNQITGVIPLTTTSPNYSNPGSCFRYKFYLYSSDPTQTPVLYDFTVNYSP